MKIYYDLTELFTSSSKFKYYGIARVVAEIAFELSKTADDVIFVIYSPAHRQFLEVQPIFSSDSGNLVDFSVDRRASPIRFRQHYGFKNFAGVFLEKQIRWICRAIDRRRWRLFGKDLPFADLSGNFLVSAARPKIIMEYLNALDQLSKPVKFIPFLHDMIPLGEFERGKTRPFAKNFLKDNIEILQRAKHVLCNSAFTKSEISRYASLGLIPQTPLISAIKLAHECRPGFENPEKSVPEMPYFLTVGATLGRKNLECVFQGMLHLFDMGCELPSLVVAGVSRNRIRDFLAKRNFEKIREKIIFCENPNQTDLVRLYKGAIALLMPTRLEGWGLPAGEAMWLGTPVVCSNIPVLHEVCGELGIYFDPDSPKTLANEISALINKKSMLENQRKKILDNHHNLRSWKMVADEMHACILRLAQAEHHRDVFR